MQAKQVQANDAIEVNASIMMIAMSVVWPQDVKSEMKITHDIF